MLIRVPNKHFRYKHFGVIPKIVKKADEETDTSH